MTTNADLLARRQAAVPRGVASATPVFAARAENAEIWDVEGRRYIDFAGGIAVVNTGHRHPRVMAAVARQAECFTHTAFQVMAYEPYVALAERLNARAPIAKAKTVFMTTGAEAVENAIKIARHYTRRPGVIAFTGGFHGRTMMTLALTGKVAPYKTGFGPLPGEVFHAPFPIPHHGIGVEDSLAALDRLFRTDIEPARVAAIVVEPVQGEGGFYIAPKDFLQRLRAVCDAHGILLICDEVQTGFARTGKLFAIEHYDIEPDLITVAKSLAGGFPLSGVIGKAEIMDAPEPGGLGGTYGGNPLGCAAALAVLDVIEEEDLCRRSTELGARMLDRLKAMRDRNDVPPIGDVRGLGAMVAFELVTQRGRHEPDPEAARRLTAKALENGLVLLSCGVFGNTLRILVPLTASDAIVDEGLDILERSLVALGGGGHRPRGCRLPGASRNARGPRLGGRARQHRGRDGHLHQGHVLLGAIDVGVADGPGRQGAHQGRLDRQRGVVVDHASHPLARDPITGGDRRRREQIGLLDRLIDGRIVEDDVQGQLERAGVLAADHLCHAGQRHGRHRPTSISSTGNSALGSSTAIR